jgi:pimeloyl-ACP methyl ester carboxylesterase
MTRFKILLAWPVCVLLLAVAAPATAQPVLHNFLISSEPLAGAPGKALAYRIRYRSRGPGGAPNEVIGVVILPRGVPPAGGRDAIAWSHGTSGIADNCAPSQKIPAMFDHIPGLGDMLAAGYAVVATDYAGFGSSGLHPYLEGEVTAYAIIDSVRGAQQLPGAALSGRYVVWGESQGGHAALWTGLVAAQERDGPQLMGVAAAAPPTDLKANLTGGTNALVRAMLTAYVVQSWSETYNIPLSTILKPIGRDLARRLAANCVSLDPMALRTKIGLARFAYSLHGIDIGKSPPWAAQLARNSIRPTGFNTPILIAQGSADPIVAPAVTHDFVHKLCRGGSVPVRYLTVEGGDHISIARRTAAPTLAWFVDRFAGRPAPNDCKRL